MVINDSLRDTIALAISNLPDEQMVKAHDKLVNETLEAKLLLGLVSSGLFFDEAQQILDGFKGKEASKSIDFLDVNCSVYCIDELKSAVLECAKDWWSENRPNEGIRLAF